ncbi:MAG: hypothetical protein ACYSR1_06145 [Planctomycetota bacterium]|jgi:type II secretory pathway pseudopilin PulG
MIKRPQPRPGHSMCPDNRGFTITELGVSVALISIIMMVIVIVFTSTYRSSTDMSIKTRAQEDVTMALREIENKLLHINEILTASTTEVMFVSDINTLPDYDDNGDFDGDGKLNYQDPDVDDDATSYTAVAADAWKAGYNLKDDDDNNNSKIDMRWRFYLDRADLKYDYSYDEEIWGNHVKTLLTNLSTTSIFSYSGSTNDLLSIHGPTLDTNSDGIVSLSEIDTGGNGNGILDLQSERNCIVTVKVNVDVDNNNDGNNNFGTATEILPPLLYLKRRP